MESAQEHSQRFFSHTLMAIDHEYMTKLYYSKLLSKVYYACCSIWTLAVCMAPRGYNE
jgi:hypothetical protein